MLIFLLSPALAGLLCPEKSRFARGKVLPFPHPLPTKSQSMHREKVGRR